MAFSKGWGALAVGVAMIMGPGCSGADILGSVLPPGLTPPETNPPENGGAPTIGTPTGEATTAKIGAAGGTLESTDQKVKLIVPPGALTSDVDLKMTPISNETPLGLGYAVRLEPDGTTFATPAKLVFAYEAWGESTVPELLLGATQNADKSWTVANTPVLDAVAKTITVDLPHFSDWSLSTCGRLTSSTYVLTGGMEANLAVEEQCETPTPGALLGGITPTRHSVSWSKRDRHGNPGPGRLTEHGSTATLQEELGGGAQDPLVRISAEWRRPRGTSVLVDEIATKSVASFTIEGVTVNSEVAFVQTLQGKSSVNMSAEAGTFSSSVPLSGVGSASSRPLDGFPSHANVGADKNYSDHYTPPCAEAPKPLPIRVTIGRANKARQYITGTIDGTLVIQRGKIDCDGWVDQPDYAEVPITGAFYALWQNYDQPVGPQQ